MPRLWELRLKQEQQHCRSSKPGRLIKYVGDTFSQEMPYLRMERASTEASSVMYTIQCVSNRRGMHASSSRQSKPNACHTQWRQDSQWTYICSAVISHAAFTQQTEVEDRGSCCWQQPSPTCRYSSKCIITLLSPGAPPLDNEC